MIALVINLFKLRHASYLGGACAPLIQITIKIMHNYNKTKLIVKTQINILGKIVHIKVLYEVKNKVLSVMATCYTYCIQIRTLFLATDFGVYYITNYIFEICLFVFVK